MRDTRDCRVKRNFTAALFAAGMLVMASVAQATIVDLGTSGSGMINGAIFEVGSQHPAGTGLFNWFLTVQNNPWQKQEPQWNHEIRFSALQITTLMQYFGFAVDINEPNGGNRSGIAVLEERLELFDLPEE